MKKIILSLAVVATLGLVACSSNGNGAADTASVDSPEQDTNITMVEETEAVVDTNNQGQPEAVEVTQQAAEVETVTPAEKPAEEKPAENTAE